MNKETVYRILNSEGLRASRIKRMERGGMFEEDYIYALCASTIGPKNSMSLLNAFKAYGNRMTVWFRIKNEVLERVILRNETKSKYNFHVTGKESIIKFLWKEGLPDWVRMDEINSFLAEQEQVGEPELCIPKLLPPNEIQEVYYGFSGMLKEKIKLAVKDGQIIRKMMKSYGAGNIEEGIYIVGKILEFNNK